MSRSRTIFENCSLPLVPAGFGTIWTPMFYYMVLFENETGLQTASILIGKIRKNNATSSKLEPANRSFFTGKLSYNPQVQGKFVSWGDSIRWHPYLKFGVPKRDIERERKINTCMYIYIYNIIITYIYIPTPVIIMGAHRKAVVGTAFKDWGFV